MAAPTQEALYAEIDLELSWSEGDLPQFERTKHVHGLHPYLGKYIPQLVDVFLKRYFVPGDCIYDPFVGSGTTLVEANVFGAETIGCDISAFNCLLSRVKSSRYALGELELSLRGALEEARRRYPIMDPEPSAWLREWFAPRALGELRAFGSVIERLETAQADVARVILSRAARSARLTTHFDLDFPRKPTTHPYYCHKHKRTCRPVDEAAKFLTRYSNDTMRRIREFADLRTECSVTVLHADSRTVELPTRPDGVITSPPYPGLIDYHEQHRYAYELLALVDRRNEEIGAAASGRSRSALGAYVDAMSEVFAHTRSQLAAGAWVLIVVNDSHSLYPEILENAGLALEDRITRHVNRRTGRRAGEFFEDILVCRGR
ncbi:MAG: DNA methyltransferase [Gaiellaceae bacterium MAG52_C11]|nr:DNA methyltransferase [Candidatus Gaiellasilicea maunaloa]